MVKRILIVDDEPSVARILKKMLDWVGFEADCCLNGDQALLHFQGGYNIPNLVITDLNMSGMDGLELTKRIKSDSPNLPVIVMTGRPDLIPQENLADAIVGKPFDFNKLLPVINRLINY